MSKMIAYCGLACSSCPAFLATKNDDDTAREKTAAFYSKKYGFKLKTEDINCDGCLSDGGRLIEYCKACEVRKCCREKKLENCLICKEQPCDKLKKLHKFTKDVKSSSETLL